MRVLKALKPSGFSYNLDFLSITSRQDQDQRAPFYIKSMSKSSFFVADSVLKTHLSFAVMFALYLAGK